LWPDQTQLEEKFRGTINKIDLTNPNEKEQNRFDLTKSLYINSNFLMSI
jgi:hypothetical protein